MKTAWYFCMLLAVSVSAQQPPKFSSKVETVRVDTLATADGKPVAGLSPEDFEVRDNGVVQKITLLASDNAPVVVQIALDTSASLTGERREALRRACRTLVARLRPGDRAGITTFSHVVHPQQPVAAELLRVDDALTPQLEPGHTALYDAVFASMALADGAPGRALLMIFSDGVDTASWLESKAVLQAARGSETVAYAITTEKRTAGFLHDLSDVTGGQQFAVRGDSLDATFTRVLDEFRQRYLLSYEPQGVARGGWHQIEVRSKRRGVRVRARPGYFDPRQ